MESEQWKKLIEEFAGKRPIAIKAKTDLGKRWGSFSKPVAFACTDGRDYVLKGARPNVRRSLFADHVVAMLGKHLDAPVPAIALVEICAELIQLLPESFRDMPPGIAHGSEMLPDYSEKSSVQHTGLPDNRPRFARLAILYGWAHANDPQMIYATTKPELVSSVDHGHFFGGGPNWTVESLKSTAGAKPFPAIVEPLKLSMNELREFCPKIGEITEADIALAVSRPVDEWGITLEERIAVADYLHKRHAEIITAIK